MEPTKDNEESLASISPPESLGSFDDGAASESFDDSWTKVPLVREFERERLVVEDESFEQILKETFVKVLPRIKQPKSKKMFKTTIKKSQIRPNSAMHEVMKHKRHAAYSPTSEGDSTLN